MHIISLSAILYTTKKIIFMQNLQKDIPSSYFSICAHYMYVLLNYLHFIPFLGTNSESMFKY